MSDLTDTIHINMGFYAGQMAYEAGACRDYDLPADETKQYKQAWLQGYDEAMSHDEHGPLAR